MFARLTLALTLLSVQVSTRKVEQVRHQVGTPDGAKIAVDVYLREGALPEQPVVVLLPDLGATHLWFDRQGHGLAPALASAGHEVVTLDWRGTGASSASAEEAGLEALLLDLRAAADVAGKDRPLVLVGWGYGGALAYAAASSGPLASRVRGVVSLNAPVVTDEANALLNHLLDRPGPIDLAQALAEPAPRGGDLFRLLWLHGAKLDEAEARELRTKGLGPLTHRQAGELLAWQRNRKTQLGGAYPEMVRSLKAPVLAIDGLLDNWSHPEFAATIRDYVPRQQVQFVPVSRLGGFDEDVGHAGLVQGATAEKQLFPLVEAFVTNVSAPSKKEAAR